jgi:erythronate-4-phosphate dehydrogenase
MLVVADERIPFLRGVLEEAGCRVIYAPGDEITSTMLREACALLVRSRTLVNRALLEGSRVRFVGTGTIGYDHLAVRYLAQRDISWANAPGCNAGAVMQYVTAALLHLITKHRLQPEELTLGVIGLGHVGSRVASAATALGMNILLNDPPRARHEGSEGFVPLDHLLLNSDIISLHVPLQHEGPDPTRHLAGHSFFAKIPGPVFFLNTSRGPVCKHQALLKAMQKGIVRDAVLDVWESEPAMEQELLEACSITTPHIAGYSIDGKANATTMIVRALSRKFRLGLNHWHPADIPEPGNTLITGKDPSAAATVKRAVNHTYNIGQDSNKLKTHPAAFEALRNNYPKRWELQNYTVSLPEPNPEAKRILEKLGFTVDVLHP